MLACAKHYLADGYTEGGKDQGNSLLSPEQLEREILPAYRQAIAAGVGSIMVSFSSVDGVKMHCHGPLLNDVLKGQLGFGGLLVSDWRGVEQLPGDALAQLASAINAGIDMVMSPSAHLGFVEQLAALVPDRVPLARIDDAVTRILAVKCALSRLDGSRLPRAAGGSLALPPELSRVGSAEHRALAREAVRASLVLLDNHAGVLPLPAAPESLCVVGPLADDPHNPLGCWSLDGDRSASVTLLAALRQRLPESTRLSCVPGVPEPRSSDRSGFAAARAAVAAASVALVVLGEDGNISGECRSRAFLGLPGVQTELLEELAATGTPIVLVVMAGRTERPELPLGPFYLKCCRMYGFVMFHAAPESQRRAAERINRWMASGAMTAKIDRVGALEETPELHRLQEQNTIETAGVVRGKLVVKL